MVRELSVSGWDIGGANIKAVRLDRKPGRPEAWRTASLPFEIWRDPQRLGEVLAELGAQLELTSTEALGLTMTAELADVFRTKRQGVDFVCAAVGRAFPDLRVLLLDLSSRGWSPLKAAADRPLDFAANNWMASALYVASRQPDGVLVDVGSTTTDIIPIRAGRVEARGLTDTDRLTHGELVYTGILRTNPNTIVQTVPLHGLPCRVAAELFASMADVHLLLSHIPSEAYSCPTADGRGKTPQEAAERLARLVCADTETLSQGQILGLAAHLHEAQLGQIAEALQQVLSAQAFHGPPLLLPAGSGAFLVRELGHRLGFETRDPLRHPAPEAAAVLPALAAASLLADSLQVQAPC